jgi:hypothetical protein
VSPAKQRGRYLGACAAAIAFTIVFALPSFSPTRVLWYYPIERRWVFEAHATGLAMDYYGRLLLAGGAALLAYAAGWLVGARRGAKQREGSHGVWAAWVATAVTLSMSLYVWQLVNRQPAPEPLPAWYAPR